MRAFPPEFPISVLVQKAVPEPDDGRYRVQGVMSIESEGRHAIAVFSDRARAVQFARNRGALHAQVGEFQDAIDFGYFLQQQLKAGFTHVCIDPLGMLPPLIPIDDALTYLAAVSRGTP